MLDPESVGSKLALQAKTLVVQATKKTINTNNIDYSFKKRCNMSTRLKYPSGSQTEITHPRTPFQVEVFYCRSHFKTLVVADDLQETQMLLE